MTRLNAVWREIFGLFVDDGWFAISIAIWLLLTGLLVPALGLASGWAGLALFTGLAVILVHSVVRRARA